MRFARLRLALPALLVLVALPLRGPLGAQDRIKSMPGNDRYTLMSPRLQGAIKSGQVTAQWADDGKSFDFTRDGRHLRFDIASRKVSDAPAGSGAAVSGRRFGPARGRQATEAWTADSSRKALYKDRNLFIAYRDGSDLRQLTTDGSEAGRIKYGTASWVYGEELGQVTAMWWSPDGSKLAYYRFDERLVKDFALQTDQTTVQGSMMLEAYPKAGTPNPIVDLFVYDVAAGTTTRMDARDGRPLTVTNEGLGLTNGRPAGDGPLEHLAFRARGIRALADRATAAGVEIVRGPEPSAYGLSLYLADPDGNVVELFGDDDA